MLRNGQLLVIDMAADTMKNPVVDRYRKVLFLGAMRADVAYVPLLGIVFEHLSLTHFFRKGIPGGFIPFLVPGPMATGERYFRQAVCAHEAGRVASAFMQLGKAIHMVVDMACPVHAHGVIHEEDPYEWYVEGNRGELSSLPVPRVGPWETPGALIESLALHTQDFPPDRTRNAIGRLLVRLGKLEPLNRTAVARQAQELIPLAAGYTVALLELFFKTVSGPGGGAEAA